MRNIECLAVSTTELVFKGGTCLAKIHAGFYRLSEDLDFVIPTPLDASRSDRSRLAAESKRAVGTIGRRVPGLRVITALTGANDSSQYAAVLGYASLLGAREEMIKIEIGLREPLLRPAMPGEARTLLLDPISNTPIVPPCPCPACREQRRWPRSSGLRCRAVKPPCATSTTSIMPSAGWGSA